MKRLPTGHTAPDGDMTISLARVQMHALRPLRVHCLNLEVDTSNFGAALGRVEPRTLAEFGEAEMPVGTKFQACGNHDAVDFDADASFKLK